MMHAVMSQILQAIVGVMQRAGVAANGTEVDYYPHPALVTFSGTSVTRVQFDFSTVNTIADVNTFITAGCPPAADGSQTCTRQTSQGPEWNDGHENLNA